MNRWLFAKQIPCKSSFLYIHIKVMWLPGGQWQSLILRTFLDYPYFCVVWAVTGIHTSCKVPPKKCCPGMHFPDLSVRLPSPQEAYSVTHCTESRWDFPAWTNRTTCRKLPHEWGQHRAWHWVPTGYCSFANLGCITESTEHTTQSLGQPPSDMLILSSLCSVPLACTWVRWHHSASSLFSSRGPEALPELSATSG